MMKKIMMTKNIKKKKNIKKLFYIINSIILENNKVN